VPLVILDKGTDMRIVILKLKTNNKLIYNISDSCKDMHAYHAFNSLLCLDSKNVGDNMNT